MSRLALLAVAPHRAFFFVAAVQGVAAIGWWLADLAGRYGGWYAAPAWTVPAPWAHAYLFLYGLFPSFVFGFLLTAMPNWVGVAPRLARCMRAAALLGSGLVAFYAGLVTAPWLAVAGLTAHLAGWLLALLELVRLLRLATPGNLAFPRFVVALLTAGWIGAATFLAALAFDAGWAWDIGKRGVWFFLLPLFFAISHRMVPFFSSRVLRDYVVWRPRWTLWTVVAGSLAHGALELAGEWRWLWVVDAPLAAVVLWAAIKWGLARCFAARLLAVLHLSLAGLAVALALYAVQSATLAATGAAILGTGPLHAMTIGYFSAMAVAMVSRVSLGHSGNALVADTWTWAAFLGLLATAVVRVLAEVARAAPALWPPLVLASGALFLLFFGLWAARYVPLYLRPRADGRPG
ncbi:MAG TPA: NnrS family protein [Burkholderiales bacterium]|nr:NnrS family protein [Burkholderiales bacterium]